MTVYVIGIGPGDKDYLVPKAIEAIEKCNIIVGYTVYVELIKDLITNKEIISTGMKGEVERCKKALEEAKKGNTVGIVSSGDAGIYGMASLIYEMSTNYEGVEIQVIPGITAAVSAASILGSPLSNDFAVISLSDLLTPWEVIENRLDSASKGDFVTCLYNPQSKKRADYLKRACEISLKYKNPNTKCGYVKNAMRENQEYKICTLEELLNENVDMFTTVIIGNTSTLVINNKLVTTRGYKV